VIIGASLAGLFAAAAADAAGARTMIIERDTLPETPLAREGVAQGRQPHVLLHRGLLAAEKLVPGIREDLLNHGAVPIRHRHHRLARRVRLAAYLDPRVRDGLGDSAVAGAAGPREGAKPQRRDITRRRGRRCLLRVQPRFWAGHHGCRVSSPADPRCAQARQFAGRKRTAGD
jgi:hypothetical protein